MQNPILTFFQQQVGKENTKGPSPAGNWLNGIIRQVEEGQLTLEFEIRKDFTNPTGIVHGGILSLMLDEVIGMTVFGLNNDYIFTSVNLMVDFLSSAKMGDKVLVTATVIRKGNKIINVDGRIESLSGKLIAKATSNMVVTQIKNPWKQGK